MKPKIDSSKCNLCEDCIYECPFDAIYLDYKTGKVKINYKKCRDCKICISVCPREAIK